MKWERLSWLRTTTLALAGFGCITAAGWIAFGLACGLLILGLSLLVIEYLTSDGGVKR